MTENTATLDSFEIQTEHRSLWVDVWRQFRKHKGALVGMFVFMLITFCVFIGPFIYDVDPNAINFRERNLGPSLSHPFGTDNIGHDTLAQMLAGGRVSLAVGFAVGALSAVTAAFFGLLAGYFNTFDLIIMRIMDAIMSIPHILLAIALVSMVGGSVPIVIFAIWFVTFPRAVRVVRSSVLSLREEVYVEAARAIGAKTPRILWFHVLPGTIAPLMVTGTLIIAGSILTEAILSFLGAGIDPETPAWGSMMADGRRTISMAMWVVGIPGGFLTLTVLGINMIGDNLRDILDPKLSRSGT